MNPFLVGGFWGGKAIIIRGLPWWHSGWESACQCRGHGFEPWSGRIPHAAEQLGPWATSTEPARLEPVLHNKRGHGSERPAHHDEEWPPLATTREKALAKKQRPNTAIKKKMSLRSERLEFWCESCPWVALWKSLALASLPFTVLSDWQCPSCWISQCAHQIHSSTSLPFSLPGQADYMRWTKWSPCSLDSSWVWVMGALAGEQKGKGEKGQGN